MESCHSERFLDSPAAQQIAEFIQKRKEQWATEGDVSRMGSFEGVEEEIYNPQILQAPSCEAVGLAQGGCNPDPDSGKVWLNILSPEGLEGEIRLVNLTFRIRPNPTLGAVSPLKFTVMDVTNLATTDLTWQAIDGSISASGQGGLISYQGELEKLSGEPVNDTCDLQFELYDALYGGKQIGATDTKSAVAVREGLIAILLNFGATEFNGEPRWLAVGVRCPEDGATFTPLSPRQRLTPVPYAVYAYGAETALSVPWSGLKNIPIGLADGVDNDTTYSVGSGLILSDRIFSVDPTAFQKRVTQSCAVGQSIRTINLDGSVLCEIDDVGVGGGDNPADELNTGLALMDTTLIITDAGGGLTVDLLSLQDGVTDADADPANERNTAIALLGTSLTITDSGGGLTVDLLSLQDGVTDADADPANEQITDASLVGASLVITESGVGHTVDLSSLPDANTLNTGADLVGTTLLITDTAGTVSADLSSLNDSSWRLDGNSGTTNNTHFIGTTDEVSVTLKVSDTVAMRYAPGAGGGTPNVIGGYGGNEVLDTVEGGAIAGERHQRPQCQGEFPARGWVERTGGGGCHGHRELELQIPGREHPPHGTHGPGLCHLRAGSERYNHQYGGCGRRGPGRHPGSL